MKKTLTILSLLVAASMLLSACGPMTPEQLKALQIQTAPQQISNFPSTYAQACFLNGTNVAKSDDGLFGVNVCDPKKVVEGSQFDVVDMAMVGTLATPWPGDEEVVGVVWLCKTIIKVILVAGSVYLAAHPELRSSTVHITYNAASINDLKSSYKVGSVLIPTHDPAHDVDSAANAPLVRTMQASFGTWLATGGPRQRNPNPDYICKMLNVVGKVARYYLYESATHNLLSWTADGNWVTFFPRDSGVLKVPDNIQREYPNAKLDSADCNNLPPFPPLTY